MAATTRLQLFLDIAGELGDRITLTADATGTTTTLISTVDMIFPDSSLNGREAWFASGTAGNVGKRRLVTNTDEETGTITLQPALPSATASADVVHLVNSRGTSVTVPEIHDKINQLIRRVSDELAVEVAHTASTFDFATPTITIPATWNNVLGIQRERWPANSNDWESLLANSWDVEQTDRKVSIKPQFRGMLQGRRVRLRGTMPLDELNEDSDTTTAPAAWIAKTAACELLEAAAIRTGDVSTAFTFGELLKVQAQQMESYVTKRWSALGRRVYVGATS